jgi:predicted transposase YbfD/YdcC
LPKKTTEVIVSTGNHYVIQVKGNQKLLLKQMRINTAGEQDCMDSCVNETKARGRIEIRKVFIYRNLSGISNQWIGLSRLVRVERYVNSKKRTRHETAYYISDIASNMAGFFAGHIQNHWGIENRLHWVKDVIMKEDSSGTAKGMAAENFSIVRNIVCNIFRSNGYDSIKYAIESCANNVKELFGLINSNNKRFY